LRNLFKHYLFLIVSIVIVFMSIIGLANWLIDPYWIYRNVEITGINKIKPMFRTHVRMAKANLVNKIKPKGIILGSSRSGYGIDPTHPGWTTSSVYNLSLPGTTIYELMRYFQHATVDGSVKEVVLALDFFMFNGQRKFESDFKENRLNADVNGNYNFSSGFADIGATLFSIDSLKASYRTLYSQNEENMFLDNGQRSWTSYMEKIEKVGGIRNMFHKVEREYLSDHWWFSSCNRYEFNESETNKSTFRYLRTIISEAHKKNIRLHLLISPNHARFLEVIHAAGLWSIYEEWKRQLLFTVIDESKKSGKQEFRLWDFSGYNKYNVEKVPLKSEKNKNMRFYWEPSHYKAELGTIILDRVFSSNHFSNTERIEFGNILSKQNIELHLDNISKNRSFYQKNNKADILEIISMAESTKDWRSKEKCKQLIQKGLHP